MSDFTIDPQQREQIAAELEAELEAKRAQHNNGQREHGPAGNAVGVASLLDVSADERWHDSGYGIAHASDDPRFWADKPPEGPGGRTWSLTDLGNGQRLVYYWGHALRYCHLWRKWLVWDGRRWKVDDTAGAMRLAKDTAKRIFLEAAAVEPEDATKQAEREAEARRKQLTAWAFATQTKSALRNMLELAASEPGIPVLPADLDRDPWALNVANGTIDLRTGQLRPHRRVDLLTKLAPVDFDPHAPCPTWQRFLGRVMNGDGELIGFLQRAVGYSATGDVSEEILLLLHGIGANGKSKFLETIQATLGQYAQEAPGDLLLSKRRGNIPNDVARLLGARFVASIETGEGEALDEGLVKHLTGGDTITARYLYGEFFEFAPTHKLWLSTNHKPSVFGTDEGIWRRILLVPFTAYIPPAERDKHLLDKLRAELPGVLAWIVGGCLAWQRQGLRPPAKVMEATSKYRADQDDLGAWIAQRCIRTEDARATFKELYDSYEAWCAAGRLTPVNSREFGSSLAERGFAAIKGTHGVAVRTGLRLRGVDEGDPSSTPLTSGNGERVDGVTRPVQKNDFPPYARGVVATHVTPSTPAPFSQVNRGDQAEGTSTPPPSEATFADEPAGGSADERRRQFAWAIATTAGGSAQDHTDAQRLSIEAPDLAALIDPTATPPTPTPWGQDAPLAWALVELERRIQGTA